MKKISWTNRIAIIAVLLMITTNPLVAVHINVAIDAAFNTIIENSGFVSAGALVYLVGLFVWKEYKTSKVNIPSKPKKAAGKFLEAKA